MKLLTNPILLRMTIVLFLAGFAFILGLLLMKKVRRSVQEEASLGVGDPSPDTFPLHTYHAVIQQLKQQKHELQALQQVERRRAKTTENISAAVLSNLSCGVLFFDTNGLVRQANAAAKNILGFAGPVGMNGSQLFRATTARATRKSDEQATTLAEAVAISLRNAAAFRRMEADYLTPTGDQRVLEVTVSPVYAANAEILGATCLINDQTEIVQMRRKQELRGEMSAEMALELRNSVASISGYAKRFIANHDLQMAEQLANDIASEAEHLERTIGGFLTSAPATRTASGII